MKAELTDEMGAEVISIEVFRGRRLDRKDACTHRRVATDVEYADIQCRDCGQRLNPVEWIARLAESWRHVLDLYESARKEHARLDLRQRIKCRCGETLFLMGRSEDEKKRRASREGRMEEALEHIAQLVPEAAAKYAAHVAAKALAVRDPAGSDIPLALAPSPSSEP